MYAKKMFKFSLLRGCCTPLRLPQLLGSAGSGSFVLRSSKLPRGVLKLAGRQCRFADNLRSI